MATRHLNLPVLVVVEIEFLPSRLTAESGHHCLVRPLYMMLKSVVRYRPPMRVSITAQIPLVEFRNNSHNPVEIVQSVLS